MKKIIFCLLFFALCVGASAQLTYTYCPPSNTLPPAYASATRQILSAFGVFPDNIALAGNSEFAIAGGGDYTPFGRRSDGKTPSLKREYTGLSMEVQARGLTCDNCTVTSLAGSPIIGTKQNPAVILAAPGTFSGNIVLKGACNFTITGTGIFRLSGVISGAGPLTYNAPDAGNIGNNAGIFLEGTAANTYSGQTTIAGGYVVCNKSNGTLSVPGNVSVSAAAGNVQAHLWCQTDNQLGSGAIVDFSGAQTHSYMHLNGTSQTVGGLKSDNDKGIAENHDGAGHWTSVVNSPPAGYSVLTIKNDGDPENPLVFAGVIRDNAAGVPLNANSAGSGGISLLKTGKGTQVLTGVNLYTGATTVSAGILRLEGNGLLGGGVYEGTLEISNTAGGNDSENIFEHKGDRTQVFNGKITNNAGAGKLGMFMQSGTGKSIINNAKDFTANVLVWKGFLGGSGDLSKVASMYVLGVGGFGTPPAGVGGGDGTDGHGATLTVPNLNLGGAFSKLVITSRPDHTPSLLAAKDKATGGPGPIVNSSPSPFTADVLGGPDLVSGYVIKCTNGVSDNIPLPILGTNNTGKTVCFKWDNTGLFMRVSQGTVMLTQLSVCPGDPTMSNDTGGEPARPLTTVRASYPNPDALPSQHATPAFSLSDKSAINGGIVISRKDNSVWASFNGVNNSSSDKTLKIFYDDDKNCPVSADIKINPRPSLSMGSGVVPCKGASFALQAAGNGPLTISSANPNASLTPDASNLSAAVRVSAAGEAVFVATDKDGCKSGDFAVTVKDIPEMEPAVPGNALTLCKGEAQPDIALSSNGTGETKADAYNWQQYGTNAYDAGLADYTDQPPTKTAIGGFTAQNATDSPQSRDVRVTPYNRVTGCYGTPKIFTITVNPIPSVSLPDGVVLTYLCLGEVRQDIFTVSNVAPGASGRWIINDEGSTNNSIRTSVAAGSAGKYTLTAGNVTGGSDDAVPQQIRFKSGNCASAPLAFTVMRPKVSGSGPKATGNLCSGVVYKDIFVVSNAVPGALGRWIIHDIRSADNSIGTSIADGSAGTYTLTAGAVAGRFVTQDIIFKSGNCASFPISITVNPFPSVSLPDGVVLNSLCSGEVRADVFTVSNVPSDFMTYGRWVINDAGSENNTIGTSVAAVGDRKYKYTLRAGTIAGDAAVSQEARFVYAVCKSDPIPLIVHPSPLIAVQPAADVRKCKSEKNVSFNVIAKGNNLIYQWQEKLGGNWKNIAPSDNNEGVAASVFTYKDISSMTGPVHLRCLVSIANGGCPPLPSGESTLSIMDPCPSLNEITYQPNDYSVCGNNTAFAEFRADAPRGNAFQWYQSSYENPGEGDWTILSNGAFYGGTAEGADTGNLILKNFADFPNQAWTGVKPGLRVRCQITLTGGMVIFSDMAVLIKAAEAGAGSPVFASWPADADLCSLAVGTAFSSSVAGGDSYLWQVRHPDPNGPGLGTWQDFTPTIPPDAQDYTSAALLLPALTDPYYTAGDNYFRLKATSACGSAYSAQARLSVTLSPSVSAGDEFDLTKLCSGGVYNDVFAVSNAGAAGTGSWIINDEGSSNNTIGTSVVAGTGGKYNLTAGAVKGGAVVSQQISFKSGNCASAPLAITVNPIPSVSLPDGVVLTYLCSGEVRQDIFTVGNVAPGASVSWIINDASSTDNTINTSVVAGADGKYSLTAGSVTGDVGVTVPQQISFKSGNCTSAPLAFTVMRPSIFVSGPKAIGNLCSGVVYKDVLAVSNEVPGALGSWTISDIGFLGNTMGTSIVGGSAGRYTLTAGTVAGHALSQYITFKSGNCVSLPFAFTVNPIPSVSLPDGVVLTDLCSGEVRQDIFTVGNVPSDALATGSWIINDAGSENNNTIGTSVVAGTGGKYSLTAGAVKGAAAVSQQISFKSWNCASAPLAITVNPTPSVSILDGVALTKLCSGEVRQDIFTVGNAPSAALASGSWIINDAGSEDNTIGTSVVAGGDGKYSLTAGNASGNAAASQEVIFKSGDGCKSASVALMVNPKPAAHMTNLGICSGAEQPAIKLATGTNPQSATGYQWKQSGDAADEVNLPNSADWTDEIPLFTAPSATVVLTRSMVITPYNSLTACTGDPQPWSVTVEPIPVISAALDLSKLCAGTFYKAAFAMSVPLEGSWAVYDKDTSDPNGIFTAASVSDVEGKGDLAAGNPSDLTQQDVVFISKTASCKSNTLKINIIPLLWGDSAGNLPALKYCDGETVQAWTPPSAGTEMTKPTAFKWQIRGTNSADINLGDYTADWTKPSISGFTAKNQGESMISRGLMVSAYNATSGCTASKMMTVNVYPSPKIEASRGVNLAKLCAGTPYPNALVLARGETSGKWQIFDAGKDSPSRIKSAVVNGSLTVGNALKATAEEAVYKSGSCVSNRLPIVVYPKPILDKIPDMTYCANSNILSFAPKSRGRNEAKTTNYQWKLPADARNSDDVGLADYANDWTKEAVSGFQSKRAGKRDISLTGYNNVSGCVSEPQVFTIGLDTKLILTYESVSPVCNGTKTNILLKSSLSNTVYSWTVNDNLAGAKSQTVPVESPTIEQPLVANGNASETVTYRVTAVSANCRGEASVQVEVSPEQGVKPSAADEQHCAGIENKDSQTDLIPSAEGTNIEWTYISYHADATGDADGNAAGDISGNTQQWTKGPLPAVNAVKDNLVLFGDKPAVVRYVFRAFNGCLGLPSDPAEVRLIPVLEMQEVSVDAVPSVCSSSAAHPSAVNITLSSSTPGVSYTWTLDKTSAPDVIGYSAPLQTEEAVVSADAPAATTTIADALSLSSAAADAQTIEYKITPWHLGCPGKTLSAKVQVNPLPAVTPPADRRHCAGAAALAEPLTGTRGPNLFKWSGGGLAGLADQAEYGAAGLPDYTAAAVAEPTGALQVTILAKNANGCESDPVSFAISASPKPSLVLSDSHPLCSGTAPETAATVKIGVAPNFPDTKYTWSATVADNTADGNSEVKIVQADGNLATFPAEENTAQEGDLVKQITASLGSNARITFYLKPVLMGCEGETAVSQAQVFGRTLQWDIVNNAPNICSGSPVDIKAGTDGDGLVYDWTSKDNVGNIESLGAAQTAPKAAVIRDILTLKDNKRGNVAYIVTPSDDDCVGVSKAQTVFVNPVPALTASPAADNICNGAQTAISLSAGLSEPESNRVTYSWRVSENTVGASPSEGKQTAFEQQTLVSQGAAAGASVTYSFTALYTPDDAGSPGCASQPVNVVYRVGPPATAGISDIPDKICVGDKITLTAFPQGLVYQWLKNGKPIAAAVRNSFLVPTGEESVSSYTVSVTSHCGNSTSVPRVANVSADAYFASATAMADKSEADPGVPINFSYTGPDAEYLWDFGDRTTANTKDASHAFLKPEAKCPTLKVVKPGQSGCTKTFVLPDLKIKGAESEKSQGFAAYPVPTDDLLTIICDNDMQSITISDISGRMLLNKAVNGQKVILSMSLLAQGVYILTVADSQQVRRVVIAKE